MPDWTEQECEIESDVLPGMEDALIGYVPVSPVIRLLNEL